MTTPEGAKGWADRDGSAQFPAGGHGLNVAPDASPGGIRAETRRREHEGIGGEPSNVPAADQEEGWTPLQFYAYIARTLGLPARFHFDGSEWVGEAPFTKPVPQSILDMLAAQGV